VQKKTLLFLIVILGIFIFSSENWIEAEQKEITTIILVRHAEKVMDGSLDAELTAQGKARAAELAYLLQHVELTAVYSTPFKRTRSTAHPTAQDKDLQIKLYNPSSKEFLTQVLKNHTGERVLIVGHSNTIPAMANELSGQDVYSDLDDSIYDNLFIVSVPEKGTAIVTRIRFGRHTPEIK